MNINPKFYDAVAIFTELGWGKAEISQAPVLPIGSPEQQKAVVFGLESGDWHQLVEKPSGAVFSEFIADVDEAMLGLFAIRCGVSARRAAQILVPCDTEILSVVVSQRGKKYATDFISEVSRKDFRRWEHAISTFGSATVTLVAQLGLPVPQSLEYCKDWAAIAAFRLAGIKVPGAEFFPHHVYPSRDIVTTRLAEHLTMCIEVGVPATGPLAAVIPAAVQLGAITREKAIDYVFLALDCANRPADRKVWVDVLIVQLRVSPSELGAYVQQIIACAQTGEAPVIEKLVVPLFPVAHAATVLPELAFVGLYAKTKKSRTLVLQALRDISPSPQFIDALSARLGELATQTHTTEATLAAELLSRWNISPALDSPPDCLWQPTPDSSQYSGISVEPDDVKKLESTIVSLTCQPVTSVDSAITEFLRILPQLSDQQIARRLQWVDNGPPDLGLKALGVAVSVPAIGPHTAMALIDSQRRGKPKVTADCATALELAWQRGLILPGVADFAGSHVGFHHIGSLVTVLTQLAETADMLSIVWPLFDAMLTAAATSPRLPAGTTDVVRAVAQFLPHVIDAVQAGTASPAVIQLPGVTAIARRHGKSQAVVAAQKILAALPAPACDDSSPPADPLMPESEFSVLWPRGAGEQPALPDGVCVSMSLAPTTTTANTITCTLDVPGYESPLFFLPSIALFKPELSNPLVLSTREEGEPEYAWLWWKDGVMAVIDAAAVRGITTEESSPIPDSFTTVLVASLSGDHDVWLARHAIESAIKAGRFGAAAIANAMRGLLPCPDFSPGRALYVLEHDPSLMPTLWPMITESLKFAASESTPPRWTSRILDCAIDNAPLLATATIQSIIPTIEWDAVAKLAAAPRKTATRTKSQRLLSILPVES